jgi:hypothetical protein
MFFTQIGSLTSSLAFRRKEPARDLAWRALLREVPRAQEYSRSCPLRSKLPGCVFFGFLVVHPTGDRTARFGCQSVTCPGDVARRCGRRADAYHGITRLDKALCAREHCHQATMLPEPGNPDGARTNRHAPLTSIQRSVCPGAACACPRNFPARATSGSGKVHNSPPVVLVRLRDRFRETI